MLGSQAKLYKHKFLYPLKKLKRLNYIFGEASMP